MKIRTYIKPTLLKQFFSFLITFILISNSGFSQQKMQTLSAKNIQRCSIMEKMAESFRKDPSLPEKWRTEGEKRYNAYLKREVTGAANKNAATEIIIPIVFHIVDVESRQAWITDRDIYEQVEILNQAYSGKKIEDYKGIIPQEIFDRNGQIPIRFVLARRTPDGKLTSGIERRTNASPSSIDIKSFATGGLDAWNTDKYVNVWAGTFSGEDAGLLGIATFPFTDDQGAQGVVIGTATLPYTSNVNRSYYPSYSEGATLAHELGHFFYLIHTFGDSFDCNNSDFNIFSGWPLPQGAGPEGDDTPEEKKDSNGAHFGNPSVNYSDGCTALTFGEMYGSYMNYFDDRALFMFSNGQRKRVEGCIDLYRPGLTNSDGIIAPAIVTDAFLVTVSPRGNIERRAFISPNAPLTATIRNTGTTTLTFVTLNVKYDEETTASKVYSLSLAPGAETTLVIGENSLPTGAHYLNISTSAPNNASDDFPGNDSITSFFHILSNTIEAPFTESFDNILFPPKDWQVWNPQNNTTWARNSLSGFQSAGAATVQNYNYNGAGQLDELITPPINMLNADSSVLQFSLAYAAYDVKNVSLWDGLEVYVSNDGGKFYHLAYKKTGAQLMTVKAAVTSAFSAPPTDPTKWRKESVNLTQFITPGKSLIIKFRQVNAYGNNLYLDDISVSAVANLSRDVSLIYVTELPQYNCDEMKAPSVSFKSLGTDALKSLKVNYIIDNGAINALKWTGNLLKGDTGNIQLSGFKMPAPGSHTLTAFTSLPNELADENTTNDTINSKFYVFGTVSSPLSEDFESSSFPPNNWVVTIEGEKMTWEKTTSAAASGNGSLVLRNYNTDVASVNNFVSSVITDNSKYDSVFVAFDYAYASAGLLDAGEKKDTLEIQLSTDCGKTRTTIWKKWGSDLLTVSTIRAGETGFIPSTNEWLSTNIWIDPELAKKDFQVYFIAKSNKRNNLYIDNINVFGKIVPAQLKKQGYLIYPNPFHDELIIRNYEMPTTLQSAAIFNAEGKKIWSQQLNGMAQKEIHLNLSRFSPGIYVVKLQYSDKTVVEKVVKQ